MRDHRRGAPSAAGAGAVAALNAAFDRAAHDILAVRILDVQPRPCANPQFTGKSFGSNAAAWWGFHYNDMIEEPKEREVITIYEIDTTGERDWARALYNFRWVPQTRGEEFPRRPTGSRRS